MYVIIHKIQNQKYHTVVSISKSNIEIVESDNFDTSNIQINDHSLSWLDAAI